MAAVASRRQARRSVWGAVFWVGLCSTVGLILVRGDGDPVGLFAEQRPNHDLVASSAPVQAPISDSDNLPAVATDPGVALAAAPAVSLGRAAAEPRNVSRGNPAGTTSTVSTAQWGRLSRDDLPTSAMSEGADSEPSVQLELTGEANSIELDRRIASFLTAAGEDRVEALLELWRFAADQGTSDVVLDLFLEVSQVDPDLAVSSLAGLGFDDLENLRAKQLEPIVPHDLQGSSYGSKPSNSDLTMSEPGLVDTDLVESVASLEERIAAAYDADSRVALVSTVGGRRNAEAADVVMWALTDPDPEVRRESVASLWRQAADGLDVDGRITDELRYAAGDEDARVAELAAVALADLDRLRKDSAESEQ